VKINQKRILIVDDEMDSFGPVMHHLALQMQMVGCEVIHTNVEVDVVELCKKDRPILIILDLIVPEIEGWKILKRLREEFETRHVPVMIVTERSSTGFDVGADDYMTKPFSPRELVDRVSRFLKREKVKSGSSRREGLIFRQFALP
jgi:DNA-binding response OmpR family regulator